MRKEKESVPVYLRQRGITFIRPTINSGGIVRRKNIGISKVKPPYEKNNSTAIQKSNANPPTVCSIAQGVP